MGTDDATADGRLPAWPSSLHRNTMVIRPEETVLDGIQLSSIRFQSREGPVGALARLRHPELATRLTRLTGFRYFRPTACKHTTPARRIAKQEGSRPSAIQGSANPT